ncbi:PhnA domain-containing protein [Sneathiella sp.]|uniref:PhnA domain-containing protein n=1 Tax=Sneathiella sp. TaxID=1964365 RepID=UPI002FE1D26A
MTVLSDLHARSGGLCELCQRADDLSLYAVPPTEEESAETCVLLCAVCRAQVEGREELTPAHWRCLNNSMWSETPAVQVMAWRMLNRLQEESWARDLLDMLYLDEETLAFAQAAGGGGDAEESIRHLDSNGAALSNGDTVILIKDLPVKGGGFTAKRGTAVRGISLVPDNAGQIEGRVEGQRIVILTEFVKKSG